MFGQTFDLHDLFAILVLVVLEGVLSIDNALVLGILARRLPVGQRSKALTYGLAGAFFFRFIAIFMASWLLRTHIVKVVGGAYLVYLAAKFFFHKPKIQSSIQTADEDPSRTLDAPSAGAAEGAGAKFWPTVIAIELTDIAFAVDSVLAAVALVAEQHIQPAGRVHPKLWVVVTGGMIGVLLVRVAAKMFIALLDRFPRFELAAYLLVLLIGLKLVIDWMANVPGQPDRVNFQSPHDRAFWIFWVAMTACFCVGFIPRRKRLRQ